MVTLALVNQARTITAADAGSPPITRVRYVTKLVARPLYASLSHNSLPAGTTAVWMRELQCEQIMSSWHLRLVNIEARHGPVE
jgi:hypothetical protein